MTFLIMAAAACTAQGEDRDDRAAGDLVEQAEPRVDVEGAALSLQPATACVSHCGCPLGSTCFGGMCVTGGFSPPPPTPICGADCQCGPATPFCNSMQCSATRCTQTYGSLVLPPGGNTSFSWFGVGAGGVRVILLGTKNGVPDEIGQTILPLSGNSVIGNPTGAKGTYVRYISLRNTSDVEVCRSDSRTITLQ